MLTDDDLKKLDEMITKRLKGEIAPIKSDIAKIRSDMNRIISFFDKEYLELRERVERIETHLHISPLSS